MNRQSKLTSFANKCYQTLKKVPKGKVTTYGTVAVLAGLPRGARLVGGILRFHGESLPWQRVINRHGYLSINNLHYPKQLQKALLEQEGVEVSEEFIVDLKRYGWVPK